MTTKELYLKQHRERLHSHAYSNRENNIIKHQLYSIQSMYLSRDAAFHAKTI